MMHRSRAPKARIPAATALCGVLALGTSAAAVHAQTTLPPGTVSGLPVPTIVTGAPPFGDTLLQEITSPLFANSTVNMISGNAVSAVYRNSGGTLDFFYQFQFDAATTVDVANTSLESFRSPFLAGLLLSVRRRRATSPR